MRLTHYIARTVPSLRNPYRCIRWTVQQSSSSHWNVDTCLSCNTYNNSYIVTFHKNKQVLLPMKHQPTINQGPEGDDVNNYRSPCAYNTLKCFYEDRMLSNWKRKSTILFLLKLSTKTNNMINSSLIQPLEDRFLARIGIIYLMCVGLFMLVRVYYRVYLVKLTLKHQNQERLLFEYFLNTYNL